MALFSKTAAPAASQQQQGTPGPGALFDVPGIGGGTQWTDQDENTTNNSTTLQQGAAVPAQGILPFKQTDVVIDWQLVLTYNQVYTTGTSALTNSAYAPFNAIQATKLLIQNQYSSVDVESGIDLYIFNLIRPWRDGDRRNNLLANPAGDAAGSTALGYYTANLAQANQTVPAQWTNALTSWSAVLRLPASVTFDVYFDLDVYGNPNPQMPYAHRAIVSPQYMAGATRVITPLVNYAAGAAGGSLDNAAVNIGAGSGTFTGSAVVGFRRKAIYSSSPAVLPFAYSWQYRWLTRRFTMSGQSKVILPVPQDSGQVLCLYFRMWDPAANGALGQPININVVTRIQIQYGSGLFAFDGTPQLLQADFLAKHGFMLPQGVLCLDLMVDERGYQTNRRALNTLTTAGIVCTIQFTGAQSASAYCVMGIESLVFVA